MTSAAIRALPFVILLIAGAIFIVLMQDKSGVGIGATDPKRFPWVLEEMYRPPYSWRFVARFPSEPICREKARQHHQRTGMRTRCRKDDRG